MFTPYQSQDTPRAASRALVGNHSRAMSSYPANRAA